MGKRGWRRVEAVRCQGLLLRSAPGFCQGHFGGERSEGVGTSPQGLLFFLWHIWYLYHSIVLIAMFFSYTGNITGYGK